MPPDAPTTLVATAVTSARIDLTWVDVATNEFEYRIERSDVMAGPFVQIGTAPKNSQAYSDLGLLPNKTYFYRVAAWNAKGYSPYAGPVSATTTGLSWTSGTMTGGPALGRGSHTAIYDAIGTRMIIFGGIDDFFTVYNDIWSFNLSTLTLAALPWKQETTSGITAPKRYGHSAIYDSARRRMIVFGGQNELSTYEFDVYVLDLATLTWTKPAVSGPPPSVRAFHTAVYDSANDQMIVYGGNGGTPVEFDDVTVLTLSTFTWSSPAVGARPLGRQMHTSIYDPLGTRMVMFAGLDNDSTLDGSVLNNETWTLSPGPAITWTQLTFPGTPGFRMAHTAVYDAANRRMVMFSGANSATPTVTAEMWSLRLDVTPIWSILAPSGPTPAGRMNHSAIFDSAFKRMVIYGGTDATSISINDVWIIPL